MLMRQQQVVFTLSSSVCTGLYLPEVYGMQWLLLQQQYSTVLHCTTSGA